MAKLWMVNVSLDFDMAVVAESEEEAEDIARGNFREESEAHAVWASVVDCNALPPDFAGSIPYGGDGNSTCEAYIVGGGDES